MFNVNNSYKEDEKIKVINNIYKKLNTINSNIKDLKLTNLIEETIEINEEYKNIQLIIKKLHVEENIMTEFNSKIDNYFDKFKQKEAVFFNKYETIKLHVNKITKERIVVRKKQRKLDMLIKEYEQKLKDVKDMKENILNFD